MKKNIFKRIYSIFKFGEELQKEFKNKKSNEYFLASRSDRVWYERFLKEYSTLDKRESYLKLINGLDENSIKTVIRTLSRIEKVVNNEEEVDVFSVGEKILIKKMKASFSYQMVGV